MTKDFAAVHVHVSLAKCLSKEAKLNCFIKGKPVSSLLISKSSHIFLNKSSFCASN